jgi:hypothetical protein
MFKCRYSDFFFHIYYMILFFTALDNSRAHFKEKYINHSPNWEQQLDRTETENLDKIIFNKKENKNFEIVRILHGAKKVISFLKLF